MSWCRWSTNIDNKCSSDLYIFDHCDDYIAVYIAGRRRTNYAANPTPEHNFEYYKSHGEEWTKPFMADRKAREEWFEANEAWEPLPVEYAGKLLSFGYDQMEELVEWLNKARLDGINFPDLVFDIIKDMNDVA